MVDNEKNNFIFFKFIVKNTNTKNAFIVIKSCVSY